MEVTDVTIVGHRREPCLDREDTAVAADYDQIHLVVAVLESSGDSPAHAPPARRPGSTASPTTRTGHQRRAAGRRAAPADPPARRQQRADADPQQRGGERGIREMMLRGHRKPRDLGCGRRPRGQLVDDEQPLQDLPVRLGRGLRRGFCPSPVAASRIVSNEAVEAVAAA